MKSRILGIFILTITIIGIVGLMPNNYATTNNETIENSIVTQPENLASAADDDVRTKQT